MNSISMSQVFMPDRAETAVPHFAFGGARGFVAGRGMARPVKRGPAETLEDRVSAALSAAGADSVIGGALPFDRNADDYLWLTDRLSYEIAPATDPTPAPPVGVQAEPSAKCYADSVARALRIMDDETGSDRLRKIVLARTLAIQAQGAISLSGLLSRLTEDPAATAYQVALPDSPGQRGRFLLGATPELLVAKSGARVSSFPLAGSARRSRDPQTDAAAASSLAASEKDRREHAMVVEYILDALTPWCRVLSAPEGTGLTSTRSMWHLGTRIEGVLKDPDIPSVLLAGCLHPTPAVCGLPRNRAAGLIRDLEPVDRGFYAGAVGYSSANGDGSWYVAIRCAEICGSQARLYAGAGIVPGSDPAAEAAETAAKFEALLRAFGLPSATGIA